MGSWEDCIQSYLLASDMLYAAIQEEGYSTISQLIYYNYFPTDLV